jgi:hypothetical protein
MILQPRMRNEEVQFGQVRPHRPQPLLMTNYALFGIVVKVNQLAQTILSTTNDNATSYAY